MRVFLLLSAALLVFVSAGTPRRELPRPVSLCICGWRQPPKMTGRSSSRSHRQRSRAGPGR